MGLSLLPELQSTLPASGGTLEVRKRQRAEITRGQLELERGTFLAHWKELGQFILPRRPRFTLTDVNKGDKRNQQIIDSTATDSLDILRAGMLSGMTSPERQWFRLITGFPDLDEQQPVKEYLHEVEQRMLTAFLKSNLYDALPILYGDMGVFGTGAVLMDEDDETLFRFHVFPIMSYALSNDHKQRVRVFVRTFRLTVQQVVEQWGEINPKTGKANFQDGRPTTISIHVQNLWDRGMQPAWVDICHLIQPNVSYDGKKIDAKYKRFESMYYELGSESNPHNPGELGLLEHSGYNEWPILVGRWETNAEDVYGTNCPGMKALGDIKQLQLGEKRSAQGIEKSINPPLTGPTRLMNVKVSVLPGDFTGDDVNDARQGIRPIYQFDFAKGVEALEKKQEQVRQRIRRAFREDVFLMFAESDRREITAAEIAERKEEKLLVLGPMLWQFNGDVADPLIERAFGIMDRRGALPPPPPALAGVELKIEYISIMAQAQKAVSINAIERFSGFVNQIAQNEHAQDILDNIDDQELVYEYADATGIPPKILRTPEAVQQIRDARQKQAEQQQAAENLPKIAGALKDAGSSPESGSPLAALLGKMRARQAINATAQPVASVLP